MWGANAWQPQRHTLQNCCTLCVVQEEEPKARQEARLIAMKERAEVAASLAEAQAMQSMAEQPGSQMDQLTEEIARIKRAEQVRACHTAPQEGLQVPCTRL